MRSIILVVNLLSCSGWAAAVVLLFPAVGTPGQVRLSGRVLKHAPSAGSSTFSKNLRRLTTSNWARASVEVRYAQRSARTEADEDGNFQVTWVGTPQPFEVGLATAEASVKGAAPGLATVDIISPVAPFFVISDLDDTLAITNVADTSKLVKAALMQDELSQPVVPGMAEFYECLAEGKPARPGFALVSGSPVQYVGRVRAFLRTHHFPVFGLYLRDVGPTTLRGYKQPMIRALLEAIPNQVVLIGDSGERDPEVYRQLRAEFPERVRAIFIRNVGKAERAERFEGMTLFSQPQEAALAAVKGGLASASCVELAYPFGKEH